jgi:hypothetical protein
MQARGAEPAIEFGGIVFDVLEVVRKRPFADEVVDRRDRLARIAGEGPARGRPEMK